MHTLQNGLSLPEVGVGTHLLTEKLSEIDAENLIFDFLTTRSGEENKISLLDTAPTYDTEKLIGRAINRATKFGVKRENILIETKVPNHGQGYENTLAAFDDSLDKLQTEYIDIYLIHWPIPRYHENDYRELNLSTWKAMEKLYKAGKIRAIGVSNFLPCHLENILQNAEINPMINQLEIHPFYQQNETVDYCRSKNILVESWGPFRKGKIFESEEIKKLADKHNVTPDKIALAWLKKRGIIPMPKSSSLKRMIENLQIPSINFDEEDLKIIAGLDDENGHEVLWNYKRSLNF